MGKLSHFIGPGSCSMIEEVGSARANDEAQKICVLYDAQVAKPVDSAGNHCPSFASSMRQAIHHSLSISFLFSCTFSFGNNLKTTEYFKSSTNPSVLHFHQLLTFCYISFISVFPHCPPRFSLSLHPHVGMCTPILLHTIITIF